MADIPLTQDPRMSVQLTNEQERTKLEIIQPTLRKSPFYRKLTKDLRLGNVKAEDKEWFRELLMQTTSLIDLYITMGVEDQEEILWTEFLALFTSTASDDGWQGDHLGSTTGTSRQRFEQKDETPQAKRELR